MDRPSASQQEQMQDQMPAIGASHRGRPLSRAWNRAQGRSRSTTPFGHQLRDGVFSLADRVTRRPGSAARLWARIRASRISTVLLSGLLSVGFLVFYIFVFVAVARIVPEFKIDSWGSMSEVLLGLAGLGFIAVLTWVMFRLFAGSHRDRPGVRMSADFVVQFSLIAMIPIVTTGIFATFLYLGIQSLFSDETRAIYDDAVTVAGAYAQEAEDGLKQTALVFVEQLKTYKDVIGTDSESFQALLKGQAELLGLEAVYITDDDNVTLEGYTAGLERGDKDDFSLSSEVFSQADKARTPVVRPNTWQDQLRAVTRLDPIEGRPSLYLVLVRSIDPQLFGKSDNAGSFWTRYEKFEQSRSGLTFIYILAFVVSGTVVLSVSVAYAMHLSTRVARPLSELASAASRISQGDLAARVSVGPGDDEMATLGHTFNDMATDLQHQRDELISANRQSDQRRRFTEAVLSGVTAGVIGLDWRGTVTLVNKSACTMLERQSSDLLGHSLADAVPELGQLIQETTFGDEPLVHGNLDITVEGGTRNLMVRITSDPSAEDSQDFVVTFDDVTDLVSAQRMSAWADVARRIAHEIRNPLTPIQLSAERLKRKYAKEVVTQPEVFEQCTETIIRQVGDIGRMVDEFSSFARMPGAVIRHEDICELARQTIFLQRVGNPDIEFVPDMPENPIVVECDGRQISQALINLLKNAVEAIDRRQEQDGELADRGRVGVKVASDQGRVEVTVTDNGCGLPKDDRHRLTEPYITHRVKGTGLGLAIVKKIMEDHNGTLKLSDAVKEGKPCGAVIRLSFPMLRPMT